MEFTGQHVRRLVDGTRTAGHHSVQWDGCSDDGTRVAAGVYLCRMSAAGQANTIKMTLVDGGGGAGGTISRITARRVKKPAVSSWELTISRPGFQTYYDPSFTILPGVSELDTTIIMTPANTFLLAVGNSWEYNERYRGYLTGETVTYTIIDSTIVNSGVRYIFDKRPRFLPFGEMEENVMVWKNERGDVFMYEGEREVVLYWFTFTQEGVLYSEHTGFHVTTSNYAFSEKNDIFIDSVILGYPSSSPAYKNGYLQYYLDDISGWRMVEIIPGLGVLLYYDSRDIYCTLKTATINGQLIDPHE